MYREATYPGVQGGHIYPGGTYPPWYWEAHLGIYPPWYWEAHLGIYHPGTYSRVHITYPGTYSRVHITHPGNGRHAGIYTTG